MKPLNKACLYISKLTESCPFDLHDYKKIPCADVCGNVGRRAEDYNSTCWLEYFIDEDIP